MTDASNISPAHSYFQIGDQVRHRTSPGKGIGTVTSTNAFGGITVRFPHCVGIFHCTELDLAEKAVDYVDRQR